MGKAAISKCVSLLFTRGRYYGTHQQAVRWALPRISSCFKVRLERHLINPLVQRLVITVVAVRGATRNSSLTDTAESLSRWLIDSSGDQSDLEEVVLHALDAMSPVLCASIQLTTDAP